MKTQQTGFLAALLWVACSVASANEPVEAHGAAVAHDAAPVPPAARKKPAAVVKAPAGKASVYSVSQKETLEKVIKKSKPKSPFKPGILREAFLRANPGVLTGESGQLLEPGMVLNVPTDRAVLDLALGAAPSKLPETVAAKAPLKPEHGGDHAAVVAHDAAPVAQTNGAHDTHDAHDVAPATQMPAVSSRPAPIRSRVSLAAIPVADVHAAQHAAAADTALAVPAAHVPAAEHAAITPPVNPEVVVSSAKIAEECRLPSKSEVASLFDRWNASLKTGDPKKVVANYATPSILLPTVSNKARFTAAEKEDYFMHFLQRKPEGKIDDRMIEVDCNSATDAGLYSFKFADGSVVKARYSFAYRKVGDEWLISSHHSSGMPEKTVAVTPHDNHTASAAVAVPDSAPKNGSWVRFP